MQTEINFETELWADILGLNGGYQVSNKGRIKSVPRLVTDINNNRSYTIKGQICKDVDNGHGYRYFTYSINGKRGNKYVHRCVAECFVKDVNGNTVNHKDGIKTNNHASNLEWCTQADNNTHAALNNLICRGKNKINAIKVINILDFKVFDTIKEASDFYNLKYGLVKHNIRSVSKGATVKKSYNLMYLESFIHKNPTIAQELQLSFTRLDK